MDIATNVLSAGIGAIQSGQRRVEQAAADIAGHAAPPPPQQTPVQDQVNAAPRADADNRPDLAESLVALRAGQNEAQAGARVVKTADEVLGTLIDTTA